MLLKCYLNATWPLPNGMNCLASQVHPALEWQVEGLKTQYVSTISTVVVSGCIRNLNQSIQLGQISIPIVRLNHEDRRERKEEGCGRLIDFYLQLPYSLFQSSAPSVV